MGHQRNGYLANLLVQMYCKCGAVEKSRELIAVMEHRDVFTWTFMIGAYAQLWRCKDALQIFHQMQLDGVTPNKCTFIYMLSACNNKETLAEGKQVHAYICNIRFAEDAVVSTALICMHNKCGSLSDAWTVFAKLRERDGVSWNAIISASTENGRDKVVLQFFQQMQLEGLMPSKVTLLSILDACTSQLALAKGKRIHAHIASSGFQSDIVLGNALVSMYGKCGSVQNARQIFEQMTERNVVSWTALIAAFAQNGQSKEAVQLLRQMQQEGVMPDKVTLSSSLSACINHETLSEGTWIHSCILDCGFESDVVVGTALVSMYAKCGSLENACKVFEKLAQRDVVCWNAMITAYTQHGQGKEALELFGDMKLEHVVPSTATFISILDTCANQVALDEGKRMHTCISLSGFESDIVVANALVNMYGKCGSLADSQMLFEKMPDRNVVTWTAVIAAHGQQGKGTKALQYFEQINKEAMRPNEVTFVTILSACSHAGLVDEGWRCFVSMEQDHSITPTIQHYDCMIDLFGRAGLLDQGKSLINSMPFQPAATTWTAFLGACKMHFDTRHAIYAARYFLELDSDNSAPYVILANIFGLSSGDNRQAVEEAMGCCLMEPNHRGRMLENGLDAIEWKMWDA